MLTTAQQNAVRRTGQDVCVVAGPGSGKTRVLIERFAWLVEEREVGPTRILAITFTEKAATEIKQRLIERFASQPELREQIERAWVSTIHGFCARLLRENAIAAGLAPDFTVLEQAAAERILRDSANEALDGLYRERPTEIRRLLEAVDLSTYDDGPQPDLARSLIAVYEAMRVAGMRELPARRPSPDSIDTARNLAATVIGTVGKTKLQCIEHAKLGEWAERFLALPLSPLTLEHLRWARLEINLGHLVLGRVRQAAAELRDVVLPALEAQILEECNADLVDLLRAAVAGIDQLYREKKRQEAALDFSDLEEEAIRLLEADGAVLRETSDRFDEILMDELQDTNRLQWRLIGLIRRSFFAVGDINQSIYSFRHAEPAVFENYRSGILQAGGVVDDLRENHRSTAEILNTVSRMLDGQPGIEPRPLIASPERGQGPPVERLVGRADENGNEAAEVEAALVASRILQLKESGECDYCDIAVLVRTMSAAEPLERALDRFGIPFLVSGGRMFFEAREVRDAMMLLAALVNPLDEIALAGVLRSPLAGVSDEELFRIGREGWLAEFNRRFGRLRTLAGFAPPDRVLVPALDESGYLTTLSDRSRANIEKLLAYLRSEHRNRPLAELLEDLEGLRTIQSEAEAPPSDPGNIVRIMSIHAAKGLEFPVVFVSGMHKGADRNKAVIAFSAAAGLGVKWRNPVTGKGQSDTAHAMVMEELKKKEEAEENRLLYVAMTRPQRRLILTYAEKSRLTASWCKLAEASVTLTPMDIVSHPAGKSAPIAAGAPFRIVDPPPVTGQYDSAAAVTSIATFGACPRKYFLGSLREAENRGQGPGGIALGLAVHQVLAGEIPGSPEEAELAARFTSSELGRRAARASRIEREFDFLFYIEDIVLRGQIDLWFEESGELVLVDYKTDRDESSAEAYGLQLRLYALALERYAGRLPDRAVLYYVRTDQAIEVSLDQAALKEARNTVRAFRDAQESIAYPTRAGRRCLRCPFFGNGCPVIPEAAASSGPS